MPAKYLIVEAIDRMAWKERWRDWTHAKSERVTDIFYELHLNELHQTGQTVIAGVGRLAVKDRKERTARNPQTGASIHVPARKAVAFKSSKLLNASVQKRQVPPALQRYRAGHPELATTAATGNGASAADTAVQTAQKPRASTRKKIPAKSRRSRATA
jgi:DNA-binding protein HU-beta